MLGVWLWLLADTSSFHVCCPAKLLRMSHRLLNHFRASDSSLPSSYRPRFVHPPVKKLRKKKRAPPPAPPAADADAAASALSVATQAAGAAAPVAAVAANEDEVSRMSSEQQANTGPNRMTKREERGREETKMLILFRCRGHLDIVAFCFRSGRR